MVNKPQDSFPTMIAIHDVEFLLAEGLYLFQLLSGFLRWLTELAKA